MIAATILVILTILAWLTKVVIEKSGIVILTANNFLFPKINRIPWSSIQAIRRYPKGLMVLGSARFGMVYGIEIEFTQDSMVKKIQLNLNGFSNKEKLLDELSHYVGYKMEETPNEMRSNARHVFLRFWGVYLLIITIILLVIFIS